MTTHSERRKAELAVIQAARLPAEVENFYDGRPHARYPDLVEALEALDALPLDTPDKAPTSRFAPPTARTAGHLMTGRRAGTVAAKVFRFINNNQGATVPEMVVGLDGKHQTISARVNELRNAGWIVDSTLRRALVGGVEATVWVRTDAAAAALNAMGDRKWS